MSNEGMTSVAIVTLWNRKRWQCHGFSIVPWNEVTLNCRTNNFMHTKSLSQIKLHKVHGGMGQPSELWTLRDTCSAHVTLRSPTYET
jgi:hypothetical protein